MQNRVQVVSLVPFSRLRFGKIVHDRLKGWPDYTNLGDNLGSFSKRKRPFESECFVWDCFKIVADATTDVNQKSIILAGLVALEAPPQLTQLRGGSQDPFSFIGRSCQYMTTWF